MKRILLSGAVGLAAICASASAFAHADIGVFLGVPGPVIAAPPVVYEPPPVVYQPAPAYYGYPYGGDYRYRREWHDNGWHRGWRHHHHHDDDDD